MDRTIYGETSQTTRYYYIHDNLGSVVALAGASGTVVESYKYSPWGEPTIFAANGSEINESTVENPYLYAGREVDILDSGSLKIQNNRHRSYNYDLARWMQADPLGVVPNDYINRFNPRGQYRDGVNIYQYVGNEPVSKSDSLGLSYLRFPDSNPNPFDGVGEVPLGSSLPEKDPLTGLTKCPKGFHREAIPGFVPTTNGCGADGGFQAPDNPTGAYNTSFKTPCDNHDICYGTYRKSKTECDNQFLKEMQGKCSKKNLTKYNLNTLGDRIKQSCDSFICYRFAKTYYRAVHYKGKNAYIAAQEKSSQCVPD